MMEDQKKLFLKLQTVLAKMEMARVISANPEKKSISRVLPSV
jgi:hypothetical protein